MMSLWLTQSHLLNYDVQRCKGNPSRESSRIESGPQSHRMGITPERQPRATYYHTEAGSVNDNILSSRAHCRYEDCKAGLRARTAV